jgi:EmrB/QacA subfamily drug resistance transporter
MSEAPRGERRDLAVTPGGPDIQRAPAVEASASTSAPGGKPERKSWVFAAALATIFMAAIEGTIVATAMPTIVGDLGGFDLFSWVFSAYLLTQAVMIPIYGRLADLYGRKHVLLLGIAVFLIGSLLSGFAWNMISLIMFRVIQGIGAGALVPVSQTIVGDIYSGEARARMQGYMSSTFGSAAILGPTIGSLLVTRASWALVFWFNIPLGLAAAVLLHVSLEETVARRKHRLDVLGSVLVAAATCTLMFVLSDAAAISASATAVLTAAFALLFVALILHERRVPEPMLPLKLLRHRIVAAGNGVGLANGAIMMSIVGFLPSYMQAVMGAGPLVAGVALAAMSVAWPIGGFAGSRMMLWWSYRTAALAGALALVAGSLLMLTLDAGVAAARPIAAALLMGFGMGVTNICFMIAIQANVDWSQRGAATSTVSFTRIVGQSLGSAVFGGILNFGLAGADAGPDLASMMHPGLRASAKPAAVGGHIAEALTRTVHHVYLTSGALALAVLVIVLSLPSALRLVKQSQRR